MENTLRVLDTQRDGAVQKRARTGDADDTVNATKKTCRAQSYPRGTLPDINGQNYDQDSRKSSSSGISLPPLAINNDGKGCAVGGKSEIYQARPQNLDAKLNHPRIDQPSLMSSTTGRNEDFNRPSLCPNTSTEAPQSDHSQLPTSGATSSICRIQALLNADITPLQSYQCSFSPSTDTTPRNWQNDTSVVRAHPSMSGRKQHPTTLSSTPPRPRVCNDSRLLDRGGSASTSERKFVDDKLARIGVIIMKNHRDSAVMHSALTLLSKDILDFFLWYSQVTGVDNISLLSFELLEVNWQRDRRREVSRGSDIAFRNLKDTIWGCLRYLLSKNPQLGQFRVEITSPSQQVTSTPKPLTNLARQNRTAVSTEATPPPKARISAVGSSHRRENKVTRRSGDADSGMQQHPVIRHSPFSSGLEQSSVDKITVRIQLNVYKVFSAPYKSGLLFCATNVDFFAWFARKAGYAHAPAELEFTLKDALPPQHYKVTGRNGEQFEYMKREVTSHFKHAMVLMPDLNEFAVLITVPGRVM